MMNKLTNDDIHEMIDELKANYEPWIKPGTYRGEANSYSILNISRFINKIYKGNRIMAIDAQDQWEHDIRTWKIKLILMKPAFVGIYEDVNETEFEAFLESVEWEVGE